MEIDSEMAKFAIATRPAEAGNEAEPHWIAVSGEDDRN
jgi:hypothetical protein